MIGGMLDNRSTTPSIEILPFVWRLTVALRGRIKIVLVVSVETLLDLSIAIRKVPGGCVVGVVRCLLEVIQRDSEKLEPLVVEMPHTRIYLFFGDLVVCLL